GQYHGLPGMILGLAFPRYYTTWYATKVELETPRPDALKQPSGRHTRLSRKELIELVTKTNSWGSAEEKQKYLWNLVL
ncbi:MAG TPA: hypothetical protein VK907_04820, partial [Phnomibacter sp.]|nr:hypothetical protein [Phnomibacter sp.]